VAKERVEVALHSVTPSLSDAKPPTLLPDEEALNAVAFLRAAIAYYAGLGVIVREVMTDNGSCIAADTSPRLS